MSASSRPWVVIVDDEAAICDALLDWLDMIQVPGKAFLSAEALLESVTSEDDALWLNPVHGETGRVGAMVVDINLPGMSGTELALRLQRVAPSVRIVLMTAASDLRVAGDVARTGLVCLRKPFALESLEQALF